MNEKLYKLRIQMLTNQRNNALNESAEYAAQLALAMDELAKLKEESSSKTKQD